MNDQPLFLRAADLAPKLRLTRRRVNQLLQQGVLPSIRRGRAVLVPAGAWDTWVAQQADRALDRLGAGESQPDSPEAQ
jgi:excisionase family DNA binding protein